MYHDCFSFRNERNVRFDCSFLSVGLPTDFFDWLGYQLIFFIRWDRQFLPVGLPADFLDWLGYQLIFIIIFFAVPAADRVRFLMVIFYFACSRRGCGPSAG